MNVDKRIVAAMLTAACLGGCDQLQIPVSENGAYIILAVDVAAASARHLDEISANMGDLLRAQSIPYAGRGVRDDVARITLVNPADMPRALQALATLNTVTLSEIEGVIIEARIADAAARFISSETIPESVAVLERRLYGQRVSIEPLGSRRIIVRTSAATFPNELRAALTMPAQLSFHLVHEIAPSEQLTEPPPGAMVVPPLPAFGAHPEVVRRRPSLVGHLERANASYDQQASMPVVSFQFDETGARTFCTLTRQHTGERFAALLDNQVLTAPMINEPICGGAGQISGSFTYESAQALAATLSAGALPTPLVIVAEGVGPLEQAN